MANLAKSAMFTWQKREAFIWIAALIILAMQDPGSHHYTLCPISNLGFDFCPGCGLGRSISYFFRGDIEASLYAHPFGLPAVFILLYRSYRVLTRNRKEDFAET